MVHEKVVRVRQAEVADRERLVEIASHSATAAQWNQTEYHKLFAAENVAAENFTAESFTAKSFTAENKETLQNRATLVIEQDGRVVGFIVGQQVGDEWEIENIAVTGSARRFGLGSRLLGEFLRLVRNRGGRAVFLEVRESNRAARALYEKWAFVETGRRRMYYQDPAEDALVLRFALP